MLLDTFIKIEIGPKNLNFYKRSNSNIRIGDIIEVSINDLSSNSGMRVNIICDYCGSKFDMEYRKYLRSIRITNTNSCKDKFCVDSKIKESTLKKWGVLNIMQLEDTKSKAKETNLKRWGTENPNQLLQIKDKIKETNIKNWGVNYPMMSNQVKDKLKLSITDKYGVDNASKLDWVKEKIKKTNRLKWGVSNYTKTVEYKERSKNTSIEKWGVSNYSKTEEYRSKTKKTNLEKWGVEVLSHSEEFRKGRFTIANHPNYIKLLIDEKLNEFECDCGNSHHFKIHSDNFYQRVSSETPLCTICYPIGNSRSIKEEELYKFIRSIYSNEIIQSYRDDLEVDIYLPDLKLGFEFNGLIWHSSLYKSDKNYHRNKTNHFINRGIRIVHIWEDDWSLRNEIVKSQIKNLLKETDQKIWARNCQIKEVDVSSSRNFLDKNHIQGFVRSSIKIGLYLNGDLVSLMTFDHSEGRSKMSEYEWNLNRFCNKNNTNIVGGASKILSYFIKNYNPKRIVSYSDMDWSVGDLYKILGFDNISISNPDYKYLVKGRRVHKSRFRKSYTGIIESNLDIPKIWDCGKTKWELKIDRL